MTLDMAVIERIGAHNDVALLRLFGSAARGEESEDSDIDLLVEFVTPKSLLDLVGVTRI